MQTIHRSEIPDDHFYYRTSSLVYQEYLERFNDIDTMRVADQQFGWKKDVFGKYFGLVKFERIDTEPDIDFVRARGFRHGMMIWVPYRRTDIPPGWRKLWLPTHFTRTGYSILEGPDYYKKWNERARRARKKFLAQTEVRIELVSPEVFIEAFGKTKVKHPYRSDYIKYYRTMASIDQTQIRSYLAYIGDHPVA